MRSSKAVIHVGDIGRTLVIMAKAPRPGMVKTRLAQNLGVEAATELYRCLLDDTLALAHSLQGASVAMMCPAADLEALELFVAGKARVVAQQGDGLAAALTSVFAQFAASADQHVIAFNSDSPHLPVSVLESGFELLATHDVVVGPTHDGGYYLVGAKASHPALFRVDGMGTNSALDELLARAHDLELSVGFTNTFYDIDVEEDLARFAAELRIAPDRAPQTAAWLRQWQRAASPLQTAAGDL